jgi:2-isopropylmalate synthase
MIEIFDVTLRDGTQSEDISLSCDDKIRVARRLDDLGFDFIEGGWPGSNPKDVEFFERAQSIQWKHALISAFGSTCKARTVPQDDSNIQALLDAGTQVCSLFGKTWNLHVTDVLRTTLEDNLRMIEESVAYLRQNDRRVVYDAEHFFDGYKADPDYAIETFKAAIRGGAETVVMCDTNGGTMPWEITEIVRTVRQALGSHPLGIHAHDDSGCAIANTLAAVGEGCRHIQGTINGYGERCGNANLCSVIPNLELKMDHRCLPEGGLEGLYDLTSFVSEVANQKPNKHHPYVGKSAFAHKGGVHVAAMRRNPRTYQHIDPELVGNQMRVVVSELSGRGNLASKAEEYGLKLEDNEKLTEVLQEIKSLESQGFSFEAAEASVAMMLKRQDASYSPPFELIDFSVTVENREGRGLFCEATVKVRVNGEVFHTAADGNGPVNALDTALRKALVTHYPHITLFHLADYKVRILDSAKGTGATTRVLIDTQNGKSRWSTVGASTNIIEASWRALFDSFEYGLAVIDES